MRRPRGGRMEYVSLGRGGPDVSAVGLGMWQAGGKAWGSDVRDAECREAMERAVELGINLVDTAEAYGDGHSERVMSRAIRNVGRDRVFVATKVGGWHLRADDVKKACAASLKRLGVREIDLYQVHWPDPWSQVPLRETMKALEALHRAGRIRNIGVSNFAVRDLTEARSHGCRVTETSSRSQGRSGRRNRKRTRGPPAGPSAPAKFARSAASSGGSGSIRSEAHGFLRRITIAATTATMATMMTTPPMRSVVSIPPPVPPPPPPPVGWTTSDPCWAAYPWTPQK